MSQRNSLLAGLIIAICGTVVLGTDRLTASADSTSLLGQSVTVYTLIGLGLLAVAAIWIFLIKPKKQKD
jgi:LPXTG-motif cell wall-anchored protein